MPAVFFRNPGVIDPRSITTFGVSAKTNDNAIGFFGTGLKYALAILLREGHAVDIYAGKQYFAFGTREETIRNETFHVVTMNGEPLGFTTELGKTWQIWQAFRELESNCRDEGGQSTDEVMLAEEGHTQIVVYGEAFYNIWSNRSDVFLDSAPLYEGIGVSIHPGSSKHVYYRGVQAYQLPKPSLFTYNVKRSMNLTEDRSIKYQFDLEQVLRIGFGYTEREDLLDQIVTAPQENFEAGMNYDGVPPGETLLKVVGRHTAAFNPRLNSSVMKACQMWLLDRFKDMQATPLSDLDAIRLERAILFCERIGFPVREYEIRVVEHLGEDVLGRAHNNTIFLSKRVFMMGTKMLAGTVMEEFIHLRHKLLDQSRGLQNFLVDLVMTVGERMTGEPL
jgi:hypothetical protein